MLTFEGDAVFVLAPTARVSRRVYITEPLPRQQTEPQSQRERESGEDDAEILESDGKQTRNRKGFNAATDAFILKIIERENVRCVLKAQVLMRL